MLPARDVDVLVQESFGHRLEARGFERVTNRTWVRSEKDPIREVMHIWMLKAAQFLPVGSLSIGTVPHVTSTGEVGWHRTPKSVRPDLSCDPQADPDDAQYLRLLIRTMDPESEVAAEFERSASAMVERVDPWFARVSDLASLVPMFDDEERLPRHWSFLTNRRQQLLARAFVHAGTGELSRGREYLDLWCETYVFSSVGPVERKREALARKLNDLLERAAV